MSDSNLSVDDPSQIRYQSPPVQVSSVGFNTLKKQPTNLSTSSLATLSSKSHTLTRLFTRSKPNLPLSSDIPEKSHVPAEIDKNDLLKDSKSYGIFGISRRQKTKLKLSNKASKKPELTIQTGGHGNLKIPKKILSSDNSKDFNKLSSPVSRHPLYRPLILSFAESQSRNSHDELSYGPLHFNVNPHRTAVTLSSQSSNSFITDINTAVMFNFTDPDFTGTNDDQILDLHRRYMTSADYYMQWLHKSPIADGPPVSANASNTFFKEEKPRRMLVLNVKDDDRMFLQLFDMIRPIFTPSKETKLQNGCKHPQMTLSVEHIATFVNENILPAYLTSLGETHIEGENDKINVHTERSRANTITTNATVATTATTATTSSYSSSGQFVEDDLIEIRGKELAVKLSNFFCKCCQTLAKDLELCERKPTEVLPLTAQEETDSVMGSSKSHFNLSKWRFIRNAWCHFNSKSRFFLLDIFFEVEMYYEMENAERLGHSELGNVMNCDKELLLAFRDTFIVPLLRQRSLELDRLNQSATNSRGVKDFLETERLFFVQDPLDVKNVLNTCFGILSSHSQEEEVVNDDLHSANFLFIDFVQCFNSFTRA